MFFEEKPGLFKNICCHEDRIDDMTEKISEYIIRISQQNLSRDDAMKLYSLMRIVADIERLCDHIVFVADIFANAQKDKIVFSEKAKNEIAAVYGKLRIMQNLIIKSMSEDNVKLAREINEHENKVDEIIKKISGNSQKRLENGTCSQEEGGYFSGILSHLERVGDHYDNIAYAIIDRSLGKKKRESKNPANF
jgi:phosphate:Na+ symporter